MDATDEFRYIAPKDKAKRRSDSEQDDRNVPVCVTNSNKNVKLQFMWDKAFKLFRSHRTVYKAVSGVNFQDYRTGGNSLPAGPGSSVGGLGYPSRSFSHSHLNRLAMDTTMMPGSSSSHNEVPHLRSYKKNRSEEQVSLVVPKNRQKRGSLHIVDGQTCGGCDSFTCSHSRSSSSGSKNNNNNNSRPVSISGGEKPEGDGDDGYDDEGRVRSLACTNANSTGNLHSGNSISEAHIAAAAAAVHLRRSQSTKSADCDSSRSDGNRSSSSYHFYDDIYSPNYYCYPNSSYGSRETSPYPEKSVSKVDIIGGQCGGDYCTCEDLYGHDSGLDTWKTPTNRANNSNNTTNNSISSKNNTEKSSVCGGGSGGGGGGHSAIVCTISTKIPTADSTKTTATSETSSEPRKDGSVSCRNQSEKMDAKNNKQQQQRLSGPNTTVVLISEPEPVSVPSGDSSSSSVDSGKNKNNGGDVHKVDDNPPTGFFSDYECMSEIDLNSDSGSSEEEEAEGEEEKLRNPEGGNKKRTSSLVLVSSAGDKMRFINGHPLLLNRISSYEQTQSSLQLLENELDSLDLTLFEQHGSRGVGEKERTFLQAVRELENDCLGDDEDNNDPLYDTVTESDPSSTSSHSSSGHHNSCKENLYWNWSDAGSEFEFIMTPANILSK